MTGAAPIELTWRPWGAALDEAAVVDVVVRHGHAIGAPDLRIAAVCFARVIVGAIARQQAHDVTHERRALEFGSGDLDLCFEGSRLQRDVRVRNPGHVLLEGAAALLPARTRYVSSWADLYRSAHEIISRISADLLVRLAPCARVSPRVLESEAAVAWYAVLRKSVRTAADAAESVRLLREQWADGPNLDRLFQTYGIRDGDGCDRSFLVRTTCCLDYHLGDAHEYCATCPLIDPSRVLARRESALQGLGAGAPFGRSDLRKSTTSSQAHDPHRRGRTA